MGKVCGRSRGVEGVSSKTRKMDGRAPQPAVHLRLLSLLHPPPVVALRQEPAPPVATLFVPAGNERSEGAAVLYLAHSSHDAANAATAAATGLQGGNERNSTKSVRVLSQPRTLCCSCCLCRCLCRTFLCEKADCKAQMAKMAAHLNRVR